MPLLPAAIPAATEKRADRVPTRLAHNVAPLFGVPTPAGPFAPLTWLCDFNLVTISEIARGAPLPTRSQAKEIGAVPASPPWTVHDRVVVTAPGTSLPNEIINATTNRFGPHTKSALVLTATNVLLDPVTTAVETALPLLRTRDGGELPLRLRIVVWATVMVEVFRSQPALVIAAIKARAIQRESLDSPRFAGRERRLARCEIGADVDEPTDPVTHPRDLKVFDQTVSYLRLAESLTTADDTTIDWDSDEARSPARNLRAEIVNQLLKLLLDAAHSEGVGYVWESEPVSGQVVAEAMLPTSGIVEDLVDLWRTMHPGVAEPWASALPKLPDDLSVLPVLARRSLLLAALGAARTLRFDIDPTQLPLADFLGLLDDIAARSDGCLDANDPVRVVVDVRLAALRVAAQRHDLTNRIEEPVDALVNGVRHGIRLCEEGVVDRGTLADLLSAACVELNAVRLTNAAVPGSSLPSPDELAAVVRDLWHAYAATLELDLASLEPERGRDVGYHLHNYATFLGSLPGIADRREAVRLFRDFVIPSRKRLYRRLNVFGPLGRTYYVATATTSRLSQEERAAGRGKAAAEWAALGYKWISRALEHNPVDQITGRGSESEAMFALRAAPALLLAMELGVVPVTDEIDRVQRLLKVLDRRMAEAVGKDEDYNRHAEVEDIRARIATLTVEV